MAQIVRYPYRDTLFHGAHPRRTLPLHAGENIALTRITVGHHDSNICVFFKWGQLR